MGFAFAEELIYRGGKVDIIVGNVSDLLLKKFTAKFNNVKIESIRSSKDMKNKISSLEKYDIYIMAAAVADYTVEYNNNKIKKENELLNLPLEKTDDILLSLKRSQNSIYIGFAAETERLEQYAQKKLAEKNLDIIVGNIVGSSDSGFDADTNTVTLFYKDGTIEKLPKMTKDDVANLLLDRVIKML